MIVEIVPILFAAVTGYLAFTSLVAPNLDSPANNKKAVDKTTDQIKNEITKLEAKSEELKEKISTAEKEADELDKEDNKKKEFEAKQEELKKHKKELKELRENLTDLEIIHDHHWRAKLPHKFTFNNGFWSGGFILALFLLWKVSTLVFRSIFRSIGFEE